MDKNNVAVSGDNVKEQMGKYRHKFKTPFTYEDKTYTELEFNFEKLKGKHLVDIENEMAAVGEYALSPEISTSFLYRLAA